VKDKPIAVMHIQAMGDLNISMFQRSNVLENFCEEIVLAFLEPVYRFNASQKVELNMLRYGQQLIPE
jgi:hypothetical protein